MHLPTLPSSSNSQVYIEGDVSIDTNAVIAPGVILRADPDSKIVIAAGVCIGMGSVLHAFGGTLDVEAGANLGAGVLFVGKGTIGANACIGAVTTIWNTSIDSWQVVPTGSLLGDKGRQIVEGSSVPTNITQSETLIESDSLTNAKTNENFLPIVDESLNGQVSSYRDKEEQPSQEDSSTAPDAEKRTSEASKPVYGQGSLDRILKTLLPYNQSLNRPPEDD